MHFRANQHTSSLTFNNISKVFKNSHFFTKNIKNFLIFLIKIKARLKSSLLITAF